VRPRKRLAPFLIVWEKNEQPILERGRRSPLMSTGQPHISQRAQRFIQDPSLVSFKCRRGGGSSWGPHPVEERNPFLENSRNKGFFFLGNAARGRRKLRHQNSRLSSSQKNREYLRRVLTRGKKGKTGGNRSGLEKDMSRGRKPVCRPEKPSQKGADNRKRAPAAKAICTFFRNGEFEPGEES